MTSVVQSPIQHHCISCLILLYRLWLSTNDVICEPYDLFQFTVVFSNQKHKFTGSYLDSFESSDKNSLLWFQVLLTILIMWAICGILTFTNVFPSGHPGRTDYKINILEQADWFRVPYPGELKDTHCDFNLQDRQTNKKWYESTTKVTSSFHTICICYCRPVEL